MRKSINDIPTEQLVAKYKETGSVWKTAEAFGVSGQAVHSKLRELGICKRMNIFTDSDMAVLKEKYLDYRSRGELQKLADELGRTKQFICRKAGELGLTDKHLGFNFSEKKKKSISETRKEWIKTHGHPRGAAGLVHTGESRKKMGEASKRFWTEHYDEMHTPELRRKRSDIMMWMLSEGRIGVRSRSLVENVEVGGKAFQIKSSWEYDIALYLEYLKQNGLISDWEYEPRKFVFKYNTLGVRTYKPDFSVIRGDRVYYVEVKGWPDKKFSIKKRLMEEEFPDIKMIYVMKNQYFSIQRRHGPHLDGWGTYRAIAGKGIQICSVEGCEKPLYSNHLCRHHFYEKYHK